MKYSVVVPMTKSRLQTAKYTLKSVLNNSFQDYEIVLLNNGDAEEINKFVDEINSDHIKLFSSTEHLPIWDSWNKALDCASGEYIHILGSDDGYLNYTLAEVDKIISQQKPDVLTMKEIRYKWPSMLLKNSMSDNLRLMLPEKENKRISFSLEEMKKIAVGGARFQELPMIYNSFISRKSIEKVKNIYGVYCLPGTAPDIFSGFTSALIIENIIYSGIPLSISGVSEKSTGINAKYISDEKRTESSRKDISLSEKISADDGFVRLNSTPCSALFSFCKAYTLLNKKNIDLDYREFVKNVLKYSNFYNEDIYSDKIGKLSHWIQTKQPYLYEWFIEYTENKSFLKNGLDTKKKYKTGFINGELVLDASLLGIKNVYDVGIFAAKIYGNSLRD